MDKRLKQQLENIKLSTTWQKSRLNNYGLTLTEVMVVVFVIGVLMTIAFPKYGNVVSRQRAQEGEQMLLAILGSQKRYQLDHNGAYSPDLASLDIVPSNFNTNSFNMPTADNNDDTIGLTPGLAQIQYSDATYTLWINQSGQISCIPAGSTCTSLGY